MSRTNSLSFEGKSAIEILVKPKSRESSIHFDDEKKLYVVMVKAQAEDGKANADHNLSSKAGL